MLVLLTLRISRSPRADITLSSGSSDPACTSLTMKSLKMRNTLAIARSFRLRAAAAESLTFRNLRAKAAMTPSKMTEKPSDRESHKRGADMERKSENPIRAEPVDGAPRDREKLRSVAEPAGFRICHWPMPAQGSPQEVWPTALVDYGNVLSGARAAIGRFGARSCSKSWESWPTSINASAG